MVERRRLPELVRRAFALRDQLLALIVLIVVIDVLCIAALLAWVHHHTGKTTLACLGMTGTLGCALVLSRHVRRERRDVLAAIRRTLQR